MRDIHDGTGLSLSSLRGSRYPSWIVKLDSDYSWAGSTTNFLFLELLCGVSSSRCLRSMRASELVERIVVKRMGVIYVVCHILSSLTSRFYVAKIACDFFVFVATIFFIEALRDRQEASVSFHCISLRITLNHSSKSTRDTTLGAGRYGRRSLHIYLLLDM
ncbi:hypothetical protein BDR06DRAFT_305169 [Suillus hirtellus]|nr:hypothetical protein BDR06DRAFT_305169 [Suillus hirtellus]